MSSTSIHTVGVIGTGVIGASWTALFLAKGLRVIVTDPAPGAEEKLREYVKKHCSEVSNAQVSSDTCLDNLTFVNEIDPYLGEVDMIQEVSLFKQYNSNISQHTDWESEWTREIGFQTSTFCSSGRKYPGACSHRIVVIRSTFI